MEGLLKKALGVSFVKEAGYSGSGCISSGATYETNKGKFYVKLNPKIGAKKMFDGELQSLKAIQATNTVRVPKPEMAIPDGEGAILIMEHLDLRGSGTYSAQLGEQLARMHLHNEELGRRLAKSEGHIGGAETDMEYITKFGFHVPTCCGYIPMNNEWKDDWVKFYVQHRLKYHLDLIEKEHGEREAMELWPQLERNIPGLFKDVEVKPALLHGDLWGGNTGEIDTEAVIYDPSCFYGHSEYELAIAGMFGGFDNAFYSAYHKAIPKAPGFEGRHELYKLFHYLNHWLHFGSGYKSPSISIMRRLAKT